MRFRRSHVRSSWGRSPCRVARARAVGRPSRTPWSGRPGRLPTASWTDPVQSVDVRGSTASSASSESPAVNARLSSTRGPVASAAARKGKKPGRNAVACGASLRCTLEVAHADTNPAIPHRLFPSGCLHRDCLRGRRKRPEQSERARGPGPSLQPGLGLSRGRSLHRTCLPSADSVRLRQPMHSLGKAVQQGPRLLRVLPRRRALRGR